MASVSASPPLASTGGPTPDISLADAVPVAKGGTGVATALANRVFAGPASGVAAAPGFRQLAIGDMPAGLLTASSLFFSPIALGAGLGWSQIAGGYVWGTSWLALRDTTIVNVVARTADASGLLYLKLWIANVAVASGTVTVTGAGVYTLASPFSRVVPAGTTFTVSAYADAEVQGISYFANSYFANYPAVASPTLMLVNPRLYGSGDVEPSSTSSNYIFGAEPTVGG